LRRVVDRFQPEVRFTANQNILLVNVRPEQRAGIEQVLEEHGVSTTNPYSPTSWLPWLARRYHLWLALAESERALPGFLTQSKLC